jgi:hypothetical protein
VAGVPVWQKERLPLVPKQEQPEPLSEPAQEPAVGAAEQQWFERVQRRRGIERRKPFR